MELIKLAGGFSVHLFASEPDIGKPIAMDWDERGRLWIIETSDYPNTVSGQPDGGDDRILICEDTDGDGKADAFKVFAEGLATPTSFTFVPGGVLVAQAPHFLLLKDLDGDDIADTRTVVMTGWGVFDTHAGPSNLRYGLDNKLWGTVGYSGFDGSIGGRPVAFGQGVFRFDSDVRGGIKDFEYLAGTSNNTWGLGFSEEFDVFVSCTNNEHSVFLGIPQKYYEKSGLVGTGIEKIDSHYQIHPEANVLHQMDVQGGFTAATGHNLYTARSFPKEYWNRTAFICEPTGRLVHRHVITPNGSGFLEMGDGKNILASADSWFSPVEAKVGPDGALWLLDWYNFMVQHTPQEQGDGNIPGRDLFRGRIYRMVYERGVSTTLPEIAIDRPATLVQALRSENMFWRITAQRLIVQHRLVGVTEQLLGLIEDNVVDEVHTNGPALHAIWTLSGLGLLDGSDQRSLDVVLTALKHKAPGVRKAAIQVLPVDIPFVADRLLVSGILEDPDNRVRLAGYLALTEAKSTPTIGKMIFSAANDVRNTEDKWISQALKMLARIHNRFFLDEYNLHFDPLAWRASDGTLIHQLAAGERLSVHALDVSNGVALGAGHIPDFAGKPFTFVIAANDIPTLGNVGLIAYGNEKNGVRVSVNDGILGFHIFQQGNHSVLYSKKGLPADFTVKASLVAGGRMALVINDQEVDSTMVGGLFSVLPTGLITVEHIQVDTVMSTETTGGWVSTAKLIITHLADFKKKEPLQVNQIVSISACLGELRYDNQLFTVRAGSTVKIEFSNPSYMQHNLVIVRPGALKRVSNAAAALARGARGFELQYVPATEDVLFASSLVNPNERCELIFTAPSVAGKYPFLCTFPGHSETMHGIMNVIE